MPYQGILVSIDEMFDELVRSGRERHAAAIELQRALDDGAIVVIFNDEPLRPEFRAGIGEMLRAFVADPRQAHLHFGWATDIMTYGRALRAQFENVCGLSKIEEDTSAAPNRRFVSDEKLVAEALEEIQSGRWANAHQAAQALAERAEGASRQSTIVRLGIKIRKAMS
jgi:hypothetical protein